MNTNKADHAAALSWANKRTDYADTKPLTANLAACYLERDMQLDAERKDSELFRQLLAERTTELAAERKAREDAAALDARRLDWLDQHCAFVADSEYKIGPFAIGELRQMADAGLAADWVNSRISAVPYLHDEPSSLREVEVSDLVAERVKALKST